MTDRERLQDLMRALAIADDSHEALTLTVEDVRVLCKALRIASVMDGTAILYAMDNETLSAPSETRERVAVIGTGAAVCGKCGHAITPTSRTQHEAGECWPTARRAS